MVAEMNIQLVHGALDAAGPGADHFANPGLPHGGPGDQGQIPSGCVVIWRVKPVRIGKMGMRRPEFCRSGVHHVDERGFAARDVLRRRDAGVIGGPHQDGAQHIVRCQFFAKLQMQRTLMHVASALAGGNRIAFVDMLTK